MAYLIRAQVDEAKVARAVRKAEKALRPDVVRIRYSFEDDWVGDPAIFFRVVLSDDASREGTLGEVRRRVRDCLRTEVKPEDYGLRYYFNLRSFSEQEDLKDPAWA